MKRNILKNGAIAFLPALFGWLMQGCLAEDLSECGASIHFQYTKNVDGIDKFASEIKKINLYVFDAEGLFLGEYTADEKLLSGSPALYLPIPPGTYTLVAWGNLCKDYELPTFEKRKTTLREAFLSLKRSEKTVSNHPGSLFFGALPQVEVKAATQKKQRLTIDMMKDTKRIRVVTKGLPSREMAQNKYGCSITSVNGDYRFDNSISGTECLLYLPQSSVDERGALVSEFVVMRELNNGSTQSKLTFTYRSPDGSSVKELFSAKLTDILLSLSKTKNLDLEDYFEIEMTLDYTNGGATVHIKGWDTVDTGNGV
jgi:hypothetical protein